MGTLFIIATPIGNLEDITLRAIEVLRSVDYIVCEDTRHTGNLLHKLQITSYQLISYYEQNELRRIPEIIALLKNGNNVALVTDAGTPAISDPGFKLVRECIGEGLKIESIPGPSSPVAALTVSGLPTDKFLFLGYPSKKEGHRKKLFNNISSIVQTIKLTIIIFEAPHRIVKTLQEMKEVLGDIDIVICRELTKIHEEVRREKISQSLEHFKKIPPKGEFVILFHI